MVDPLEKRVAVLSREPQGFLHFDSWIQVRFQDLVNRLNCELLIEQVEELSDRFFNSELFFKYLMFVIFFTFVATKEK